MSILETFLEVKLHESDDFLKIKETLTRIGVASKKENKLFQSCHILHKRNKYYIVHFKEMFLLDGKTADFDEDDVGRRNSIAWLLHEWELLDIIDEDKFEEPRAAMSKIKILPYKDKKNWSLESKYSLGKKY